MLRDTRLCCLVVSPAHALKRIFWPLDTRERTLPNSIPLFYHHAFLGVEQHWPAGIIPLLVVASKPNTDSRETVFNQLQVVVLLGIIQPVIDDSRDPDPIHWQLLLYALNYCTPMPDAAHRHSITPLTTQQKPWYYYIKYLPHYIPISLRRR